MPLDTFGKRLRVLRAGADHTKPQHQATTSPHLAYMTTTRQVAKIADISEQSVRNYTRDYADLLSPQARGEQGARLFLDSDIQTICTIATLRKEDVPRTEIIARLQRGDIVVEATPSPQQTTPSPHDAPHAPLVAQVTLAAMQRQLNAIQRNQELIRRNDKLQGALWGAIAGVTFCGFVVWVLWLMAMR